MDSLKSVGVGMVSTTQESLIGTLSDCLVVVCTCIHLFKYFTCT